MGLVFLRHAYSRYLAVKDEIEAGLPTRGGKKRAITKQDFSRKSAIAPSSHRRTVTALQIGNIGSGGKHVLGGVAGTIQCVLGRPSQITSRPDLHHLCALFRSREQADASADRNRISNAIGGKSETAGQSEGDSRPEYGSMGSQPVSSQGQSQGWSCASWPCCLKNLFRGLPSPTVWDTSPCPRASRGQSAIC